MTEHAYKRCIRAHDYDIDTGSGGPTLGRAPARAGVVELVDTLDLGSSGFGHGGSSPFARTSRASRPRGVRDRRYSCNELIRLAKD